MSNVEHRRNPILQFLMVKCPAGFTIGIAIFLAWVFNFRFLPSCVGHLPMFVIILIGIYLNLNAIMIIWSHLKCLSTNPGFTTDDMKLYKPEAYNQVLRQYKNGDFDRHPRCHKKRKNRPSSEATYVENENTNLEEQKLMSTNDESDKNDQENGLNRQTNTDSPNISRKERVHPNTIDSYCPKCDNIKPPRTHHCSV